METAAWGKCNYLLSWKLPEHIVSFVEKLLREWKMIIIWRVE